MYASKEIYSDIDIDRIWSLSPATGAQHQHVNRPIVNADAEGIVHGRVKYCADFIVKDILGVILFVRVS